MKLQRFLLALTLCVIPACLAIAQVKVEPRYEPYTPIVAEYQATVPPDAQIQANWSVSGVAKLVQVSPLKIHVWAPPGTYDVGLFGLWLKTREVDIAGAKVQVLEGFGLLNSKSTFVVGQADPPVPPPLTTNPYPAPSAEIRESLGAVLTVRLDRADATNLASLYDQARRLVETAPAARAAGVQPEIGTTSELRAWLAEHGRELGLAGKYAGLADVVDTFLTDQLGTRLRDVQASDAASLGGLAWAIWENGR